MKKKRHPTVFGVMLCLVAFITGSVLFLHDFLCINRPHSSGILVVEGWVPEECLSGIQAIYSTGNYKTLVVVGAATSSHEPRAQSLTAARDIALRLIEKGIRANTISFVVDSEGENHYTYRSAVALKNWLSKSSPSSNIVDVYTVGVHSRKSYVTFERVLSPDYQVGILSGKPLYYSPRYWFLSKKGIYLVYKNFFGYLYAKFFPFHLLA